jgi:cyanophycinase-like exopeptidase
MTTDSLSMAGSLAVVGSGEYLPSMMGLESQLLEDGKARGKKPVFVQLATAAGRESADRLKYWQRIGAEQAERLGVEVRFLPVFTRAEAETEEFVEAVQDAALIYFSGGDPNYLAASMRDTVLWSAIQTNFETGASLAGCSAGAMFMSQQVPRLRFTNRPPERGVAILPNLQVIPHFNMIHKWIPDAAVRALSDIPEDVRLIGIDDETALVRKNNSWSVWGAGHVHVLNGNSQGPFAHSEIIEGL